MIEMLRVQLFSVFLLGWPYHISFHRTVRITVLQKMRSSRLLDDSQASDDTEKEQATEDEIQNDEDGSDVGRAKALCKHIEAEKAPSNFK